MARNSIKVPRTFKPPRGAPREQLIYANPMEMRMLQWAKTNGLSMRHGPHGIPSFADDSASSNGMSRGGNGAIGGGGGIGASNNPEGHGNVSGASATAGGLGNNASSNASPSGGGNVNTGSRNAGGSTGTPSGFAGSPEIGASRAGAPGNVGGQIAGATGHQGDVATSSGVVARGNPGAKTAANPAGTNGLGTSNPQPAPMSSTTAAPYSRLPGNDLAHQQANSPENPGAARDLTTNMSNYVRSPNPVSPSSVPGMAASGMIPHGQPSVVPGLSMDEAYNPAFSGVTRPFSSPSPVPSGMSTAPDPMDEFNRAFPPTTSYDSAAAARRGLQPATGMPMTGSLADNPPYSQAMVTGRMNIPANPNAPGYLNSPSGVIGRPIALANSTDLVANPPYTRNPSYAMLNTSNPEMGAGAQIARNAVNAPQNVAGGTPAGFAGSPEMGASRNPVGAQENPIGGFAAGNFSDPYAAARRGLAQDQTNYQRDVFNSLGNNLNTNLDPTFSGKLFGGLVAANNMGLQQDNLFNEMSRSPEVQAQYRADYIGQPVTYNGKMYSPQRKGGLAAPPLGSNHQFGLAADMNSGPVANYLHDNAGILGLENIKNDQPHIQLAGASPMRRSGQVAMIGGNQAPYNQRIASLGGVPVGGTGGTSVASNQPSSPIRSGVRSIATPQASAGPNYAQSNANNPEMGGRNIVSSSIPSGSTAASTRSRSPGPQPVGAFAPNTPAPSRPAGPIAVGQTVNNPLQNYAQGLSQSPESNRPTSTNIGMTPAILHGDVPIADTHSYNPNVTTATKNQPYTIPAGVRDNPSVSGMQEYQPGPVGYGYNPLASVANQTVTQNGTRDQGRFNVNSDANFPGNSTLAGPYSGQSVVTNTDFMAGGNGFSTGNEPFHPSVDDTQHPQENSITRQIIDALTRGGHYVNNANAGGGVLGRGRTMSGFKNSDGSDFLYPQVIGRRKERGSGATGRR